MTFVEACGAAETELAEVTWQEKLSEVSADLLSQLPCYMAGGSFMTLSVDYQNLHLYTSSYNMYRYDIIFLWNCQSDGDFGNNRFTI